MTSFRFLSIVAVLLVAVAVLMVLLESSTGGDQSGEMLVVEQTDPVIGFVGDGFDSGRSDFESTIVTDKSGVWGRVLLKDGSPAADARVVLIPKQAFDELGLSQSSILDIVSVGITCKPNGAFRLPVYDPSSLFRVVAIAPNCAGVRTAAVQAGTSIDIELSALLAVTGRVVYTDGKPAGGAVVHLRSRLNQVDGMPDAVVADEEGVFTLSAPGEGNYQLQIRAALAPDTTIDEVIISAGMAEVLVTLPSEPGFSLFLESTSGEPVPDALVLARPANRRLVALGPKQARGNAQGLCEFGGLAPGYWFFEISATGFAKVEQRHRKGTGKEEIRVVLPRIASLAVTVLDPYGSHVPGIKLDRVSLVRSPLQNAGEATAVTDQNGIAFWPSLLAGNYVITAGNVDGGRGEEALISGQAGASVALTSAIRIELIEGQDVQANLVLDGHAFLELIVSQLGVPVVGAKVALVPNPVRGGNAVASPFVLTDSGGSARLTPVRPGRFSYLVETPAGGEWQGGQVRLASGTEQATLELPAGSVTVHAVSANENLYETIGVLFRLPGDRASQTVVANEKGELNFELVDQGEWRIELRSPGLLEWDSGSFSTDGIQNFDFGTIQMSTAATLRGNVGGLPVMEKDGFNIRVVELRTTDGSLVASFPLDHRARFAFEGLAPGAYILNVIVGLYTVKSSRLELLAGLNEVDV